MKVKTGNVTSHTFLQSIVLSVFITPFVLLIQNDYSLSNIIWVAACMFVAPILVDFVKPVIIRGDHGNA